MKRRHKLMYLLLPMVIAVLTGCGSNATEGSSESKPGESGNTYSLAATDNAFDPKNLSVESGPITLVIENTGVAIHNFSIPSLNIDKDVAAGETVELELTATSGTTEFLCKYHLPEMKGTLDAS